MLQDNNPSWFDDFAPLTGDDDQSVYPAAPEGTTPAAAHPPAPLQEMSAAPESEEVSAVGDRSDTSSDTTAIDFDNAATDQFPATSAWDWVAADTPGPATIVHPAMPWTGSDTAFEEDPAAPALPAETATVLSPVTRPAPRRRALRGYVIAAGLLVLVVAMAGVGAFVAFSGGDSDTPAVAQATTPGPTAPAITTPPADPDCPTRTDGPVTTGRDAGGTTSGPEVIKAFEHAYYVDRDGAKARSYGTELAQMGSATSIQTFIDTRLAPGTLHCTRITDLGNGLWSLELTEIPPGGGEPGVIRQLVQTADVDGRTRIAAITVDTNQ